MWTRHFFLVRTHSHFPCWSVYVSNVYTSGGIGQPRMGPLHGAGVDFCGGRRGRQDVGLGWRRMDSCCFLLHSTRIPNRMLSLNPLNPTHQGAGRALAFSSAPNAHQAAGQVEFKAASDLVFDKVEAESRRKEKLSHQFQIPIFQFAHPPQTKNKLKTN